MLRKINNWIQNALSDPTTLKREHSVELATAVLFYEIMRADDNLCEQEQSVFRQRISQHFSLSEEELTLLTEQMNHEASHAADFHQFTRVVNQHCSAAEKQSILDSLWLLATADGKVDAHETHLIRRIADLLHLPHSKFIQSKLSAEAKLKE